MQMITTNEVIREIEAGRKQTLLCAWRPIDVGDVAVRECARLPSGAMVLRIVPMMDQAWLLGDAQMDLRVPTPLIP